MTSPAEESVVGLIGASYSGEAPEPVAAAAVEKFEFDPAFQSKLAIHALRDQDFMRKTAHLLLPDYFENAGEAAMVDLGLRFFRKWRAVPTLATVKELLRQDLALKVIRADTWPVTKEAFMTIYAQDADLSNGGECAEQVAQFARHQAVQSAILSSVELLGKKQFDKILEKIRTAAAVGINIDSGGYDYWDRIDERTQKRTDKKMGILPPTGITTGQLQLDNLLYHRGWGRKELGMLMGAAKAGKTVGLVNFARAGSLAGFNVLYVTLEVATDILSERLDASISDTFIRDLVDQMHAVSSKVKLAMPRAGHLEIHEFPSGTFTPDMLRALIERYKGPVMQPDGKVRAPIKFDLIVVDYADIMAPNHRTNDPIENSKSIVLDLRAIAYEENAAALTATQTNRLGFTATVAKMDHVADDINKVRTADIVISINITDEERAAGEARLYFAASRNQESGFTVFIKQNIAKMQFINAILRVE